ncbi:MAG: helix-hairpin-helix domain-containing protein [Bacteroidales bacterium]|jgi:competence ComEA-like helix-hairpin-helix protein|nr:helix-hairpin-helix domain-containing protein [Bacteroidales bacterium]
MIPLRQRKGLLIVWGIGLGVLITIIVLLFTNGNNIGATFFNNKESTYTSNFSNSIPNTKSYLSGSGDSITRKEKKYSFNEKLIFDINKADTLDLQAIRGIGPIFARRIYKYRLSLGGYTNIEQLKEVYGMTDSLYEKIIPFLTISKISTRKININNATIKELMYHPYIDFFLAKQIIKLRYELESFRSMDELLLIHIMDEKTYKKIIPYLEL